MVECIETSTVVELNIPCTNSYGNGNEVYIESGFQQISVSLLYHHSIGIHEAFRKQQLFNNIPPHYFHSESIQEVPSI